MKVPFLDLKAQHEAIREELGTQIGKVIENTAFAGGPFVAEFEKQFAQFCGCNHAIGVGSGTEALWMALIALGIGPGDEVITVPNTFIATVEAISFVGAKPVFVDVEEQTFNMNPALIESAITPRTKAIIPVHLYGQMADMEPIMEIAKSKGLAVIEDAAQAHGAEYKGKRPGAFGNAAAYSFYPGKNLGACGEAGAVVTNDSDLAEKIRMLRDHGQEKKYFHSYIGWNARMDGFQGACLTVKLKYLPEWTEARRQHANQYRELLSDTNGLQLPLEADYAKHVYHLFSVLHPEREKFIKALGEKEIFCGKHYPVPVHLQEAYCGLGYGEGSFPVAERCASQQVSLPMFAELKSEQIKYACEEIKKIV